MISICVASVRSDTISYLVESILRQSISDWELIIATQGENPNLLELMEKYVSRYTNIKHIKCKEFGKTRALNRAIMEAKGDIIAFTDDDCEADENWLETIALYFTRYENAGIVAGSLIPSKKRLLSISTCPATYVMEYFYDPSKHENGAPPGFYWAGGNFAVRKNVFDIVGLFDEFLGPGTEFPGAEDVDFAYRSEAKNIIVATTPKSLVYHTYGRRYGLRSILAHYKNYALGSGALHSKLILMNHRLSHSSKNKSIGKPVNPLRYLKSNYQKYWRNIAAKEYIEKYTIDTHGVTIAKNNLCTK